MKTYLSKQQMETKRDEAKQRMRDLSNQIDAIVLDGGIVGYCDPLQARLFVARRQYKVLSSMLRISKGK